MRLETGSRLGPYEVLDLLGAGGMGEVYRATDTRLGRAVALKILPSDFATDPVRRERFEREARTLSSVSHPNVAALYDLGVHEDVHYLVMEYVEGDSLANRLLSGPVPLRELLVWATQIADALHAIHRRGIVHRDLKPSNILLTSAGAKLVDFGVARLLGRDGGLPGGGAGSRADTLTMDGALVGTLDYMAPEQLEGRNVDARADLFSLGVVIFEMAAGRRPFEAGSQAGVVAAILSSEAPGLATLNPGLPAEMSSIVSRCLEKDPERRWQSAADLAANLRWISEALAESFAPARAGRSAWLIPAAAGAAAAVAVALTLAWRGAPWQRNGRDEPVIRFEVSPPEGTSFSLSGNPLAISPDGRRIAFVASREGESERLWLRALDSVHAVELAGTDHASQPFWSADGRSLGFVLGPTSEAGGAAIRAIDLSAPGAPPRSLGRVSAIGGTWSRDGLLLVSQRGRLAAIAAGGRTERFEPPVAGEAEFQLWPSFLPDGDRFLYTLLTSRAENYGVHLGGRDGSTRRVRARASNAVFVDPGFLLYGQGSALVAQSVDRTTLEPAGEPTVLAEPVAYNFATLRYTFSASAAGSLVYRREPETELVWYDRSGAPLGSPLPRGRYRDPEISRDGTKLAVSRLDVTSGAADIWTCDLVRGPAARATFDPGWEYAPVWSPDGSSLVYVERAPDRYAFALRRISAGASGSGSERIFEEERPFDATDWIAVSDGVLWSARSAAASLRLASIGAGGGSEELSDPEFRERQGRLSPDGRWLAYVSEESGSVEVYVRAWPRGEKRKVSVAGGVEPRWRGDSRELYYIARDRRLMSVVVEPDGDEVAALGRPVALFETRMAGSILGTLSRNQYDVTPDGGRFLVNQAVGEMPFVVVVNWTASIRP